MQPVTGNVEREIIEPVDLCDDRGRLSPAARGWSRHPMLRANLQGRRSRKKRWDYWCIDTPELVVSCVYADVDYAGLASVWVLDRATGKPLFPVEERPMPASDAPGEVTSPTQPIPAIDFAVLNAGKLKISGAELELAAAPIEGLSLNAEVGYLKAEYEEFNEQRAATLPATRDLKVGLFGASTGAAAALIAAAGRPAA